MANYTPDPQRIKDLQEAVAECEQFLRKVQPLIDQYELAKKIAKKRLGLLTEQLELEKTGKTQVTT